MRDLLRKKYLLPALILALINSGCVTTGDSPGRRSLLQTYSSAHGEGAKAVKKKATKELTLKRAYGYTKPYVPVLEYPTVQKIWIPDHTGADACLVTGHWVYIILKPPTWLQVDEEEKGIEVPTIIPFKGKSAQE